MTQWIKTTDPWWYEKITLLYIRTYITRRKLPSSLVKVVLFATL